MTTIEDSTDADMNGHLPCGPKPNIELVDITPELAAEWIARNTHNRPLRQRLVARYARDMTAGRWRWNGEPFRWASEDWLIDGQHRLHAIVRAETTVTMLVINNLPREAQETIDTGASRTFADTLALRDEAHAKATAALVRKIASWEQGTRRSFDKGRAGLEFSISELSEVLESHPEIRHIAGESNRLASKSGLSPSLVGLAWWIFSTLPDNPKHELEAPTTQDVSTFFERLHDGQGWEGEPTFQLRKTLHNMEKRFKGVMSQTLLLALVIKAWNDYRVGRSNVTMYRWRMGGADPEKFPEPI